MAYLVTWHLDGCPRCGDTLAETWDESSVTVRCSECGFEKRLPADIDAGEAAERVIAAAAPAGDRSVAGGAARPRSR